VHLKAFSIIGTRHPIGIAMLAIRVSKEAQILEASRTVQFRFCIEDGRAKRFEEVE